MMQVSQEYFNLTVHNYKILCKLQCLHFGDSVNQRFSAFLTPRPQFFSTKSPMTFQAVCDSLDKKTNEY